MQKPPEEATPAPPLDLLNELWILCYPCGWPVYALNHQKHQDDQSLLLYLSYEDALAGAEIHNKRYRSGCHPCRLKDVASRLIADAKLSRGLPVFNTKR